MVAGGERSADTRVHASTEEYHRAGFSRLNHVLTGLSGGLNGPITGWPDHAIPKLPSTPDPKSAYVSVTQAVPERCLRASIRRVLADQPGNWSSLARRMHLYET